MYLLNGMDFKGKFPKLIYLLDQMKNMKKIDLWFSWNVYCNPVNISWKSFFNENQFFLESNTGDLHWWKYIEDHLFAKPFVSFSSNRSFVVSKNLKRIWSTLTNLQEFNKKYPETMEVVRKIFLFLCKFVSSRCICSFIFSSRLLGLPVSLLAVDVVSSRTTWKADVRCDWIALNSI